MRFHDPLLRSIVLALGLAAAACFPELGEYSSADGATTSTGGGTTSAGGGSQGGGGDTTTATGGSGGGLVDPTCADLTRNGSETGPDCGGDACPPCPVGALCVSDTDCASGNCDGATCGPALAPMCPATVDPGNPTCADCETNGSETDEDCGGGECWPCADTLACLIDADCASSRCDGAFCLAAAAPMCPPAPDPENPTCADCVLNGSETAEDCGGDACSPCADGLACLIDGDCESSNCDAATCLAAVTPTCPIAPDPDNPSCADCVKNGAETAVDCGGDACAPCDPG